MPIKYKKKSVAVFIHFNGNFVLYEIFRTHGAAHPQIRRFQNGCTISAGACAARLLSSATAMMVQAGTDSDV